LPEASHGSPDQQYYVWKHYLEAWAAPKFFCYRLSERKLFGSQPKVVANERDFYRTQRLSDADLRYLESLIERAPLESTRESNRGFVRMFQTTFALRDLIDRTDLPPDQREKVASELSEIERTMGEKYHSGLEDDGIGYPDELKSGSSSFYENDEDCAKFVYFLANQYFRTPRVRKAAHIAAPLGHDPDRTGPIEAHIYASNVGMGLFASRKARRIVLLESDGSVPFVTGDQPVFNLLDPTKTDHIALYYPVSPLRSMILTSTTDPSSERERLVGKMAVETYNHLIWSKCHDQVYANDRAYLEGLTSLPRNIDPTD
jgi:hypothetical protein